MHVMPCFLRTVTEVATLERQRDKSKRSAVPGCKVSCGYAVFSEIVNVS